MNIPSIFASMLSGRGFFRRKRQPVRKAPRRSTLRLEALEDRCTPATFSVLDSFSGATLGDTTVNSGGTGFSGNITVASSQTADEGIDTALQTAPGVGTADPLQAADTRTTDLLYTAGTGSVTAQTTTSTGILHFSADDATSGNMTLTYSNLSANAVENLTSGTITVDFSSVDTGHAGTIAVEAFVNGQSIGTQNVAPSNGAQLVNFDASAFVGQQINTISFTFTGNISSDLGIDEIDASFTTPTPPPATGALTQGFWKNHGSDNHGNQEDAWPVHELTIGNTLYSEADLIVVLRTPPKGDAVLILAHQLIAAKLNVANGVDGSSVAATIADADSLLNNIDLLNHTAVSTSSNEGQQMVADAGILDTFNSSGT